MSRQDAFQQTLLGGMFTSNDAGAGTKWSRAHNAQGQNIFEKWWLWMRTPDLSSSDDDVVAGNHAALCATTNRLFFLTEKGYIGLRPAASLDGDVIVVIDGSHLPTIFRPGVYGIDGKQESTFKVLGDSFVQGLVDGEAVAMVNNGELEHRKFILV